MRTASEKENYYLTNKRTQRKRGNGEGSLYGEGWGEIYIDKGGADRRKKEGALWRKETNGGRSKMAPGRKCVCTRKRAHGDCMNEKN